MKFTQILWLTVVLSASATVAVHAGGLKEEGKSQPAPRSESKAAPHEATAVVKSVDPARGAVVLAHGPIPSLNWPPMTMRFKVKDKALFDKLAQDKHVVVDIEQQGPDYVVTAVK